MPNNRNRDQTFIGPRLYTRRQLLKSVGAGALTLSAGYLQACGAEQPNLQGKRKKDDDDDDHGGGTKDPQAFVGHEMGNKAASYFDKQIRDPEVLDYVDARASAFGSSCNLGGNSGGLKLTLLTRDPVPVLDIGGQFTNDQTFLAIVDLEESPDFVKYFSEATGRKVQTDRVTACFVTNRFFDPRVSNANNQPVVGIADAVLVCATDTVKKNRPATVEIYLVDCGGVERLHKVKVDRNTPRPAKAMDKNPNVLGRDPRVNAYFGGLVAEYAYRNGGPLQTKQVVVPYDPFDFEDPLPPGAERRDSFAGIHGVQYQRVDPNVPPEEYREPSEPNDTAAPPEADVWSNRDPEFGIGLAVQGYPLGISQPLPEPPTPQTGYGPVNVFSPFTCYRWKELDGCKGCCTDKSTGGYATVGIAYGVCLLKGPATTCWVIPFIGNISCLFACSAAALAATLAVRYMETLCDDNCYKPTPL